jgi:hypothetical protein
VGADGERVIREGLVLVESVVAVRTAIRIGGHVVLRAVKGNGGKGGREVVS